MKLNKLYQRAANQKVNTFQVEIQGNLYRTITGFEDGVKTKSAWTECFGKNLGKSNETTDVEQAQKEAEALHRKKVELGFFEDINDIDTSTIFKPMLAHKYEDHKDTLKYPVLVQPKLDGIRCIVRKDGMWTRNGKKIVSAPHIYESLKYHFDTNPDLIIDGELYFHDKQNFNTICSLVKKTKPTLDDLVLSTKFIEYWVYDVASSPKHFGHRKVDLYAFAHDKYVHILLGEHVNSEEEMIKKYGKYIEKGYEGIMIRTVHGMYENKRSKHLLKYKTFSDSEFTIVDVYEGKGRLSGKCGQMLLENNDGDRFYSTANGDEEYLTDLWNKREELIGKQATVKYFELTVDGVPRFPKIIGIRDYE